MAFIDNKTIEEIKMRLSIVDVISDYVKLERSGKNWRGLCPFHMEKTPSFFVNEEKGVYHCFGCNASGNMFNFIMDIENVSFVESIKILAKKANVEVRYKDGEFQKQNREKELIYKVNKRAEFIYNFFLLNKPEGKEALEYLKKRNISKETIEEFKLGWAPKNGNKIYEILKKESYSEVIMSKAGLILPGKDNTFFDRFRGRLIFPIIDAMEHTIGFGGRIITDIPNSPKYLNTPETEVFSKRKNLYALNLSREYIREKKSAIIVEGYFDVISLYQAGIKNVVAPLGTALTEEQVLLLKRYADEIILIFDSDTAGSNATIRSISLLLKTDLKIRIGRLPAKEDPDSFVRKYGKEKFLKIIDEAPSFLNFIIVTAFRRFNYKNSEGKNKILQFLFPIINLISDEILKNDVLKYLSEKLGIREEVLINEFKKFQRKGRYEKIIIKNDKVKKIDTVIISERLLVMLMLLEPIIKEKMISIINIDDIQDNIARTILSIIINYFKDTKEIDITNFTEYITDNSIKSFITSNIILMAKEKEKFGNDNEAYKKYIEKQINDYLYRIKIYNINKKIEELNKKIEVLTDFNEITRVENEVQKLFEEKKKIVENKNKMFILEKYENLS